jgi:hypothetical protein
MRKGELDREQAVEIVGKKLVAELEGMDCEETNRLQTDGDDAVEFAASVKFTDSEGNTRTLTAYYYQDPDDIEEAGDDLGSLDWDIEGYEVW